MKNIAATIMVITAFFIFSGRVVAATADEIHYTITGPTSVAFDWRGDSTTISYGTTTAYGQTTNAGSASPANPISSAGPWREARLTGLSPATVYHYSVGGSQDTTFKTPPTPGSSGFTVYAEGDIGSSANFSDMTTVQQMIANGHPDFVLGVGDLTYGNTTSQSDVDQHFNDVMSWSRSAAYQPAWGNHEWDKSSDDLRNYKGRFDFANPQTDPASPAVSCCGEDWYYFDYGNARFIAYPEPWSGDDWGHWHSTVKSIMDSAQNNSNIKFIVTFGHRPAWSTGYHNGDSTLANYMQDLQVTHSKYVLNINGHSHNYERTDPTQTGGVMHITTGTGGGYLENVNSSGCLWQSCPPPSWSVKRFMRYGTTKLVFTENGIQGQFLCGPPGGGTNDVNCNVGDILDTFTIGNPNSTLTPSATIPCASIPTILGVSQASVTFASAGLYKVWSRVMAPSQNVNSYYLQVDNSCYMVGGGSWAPNAWTWIDYQDANANTKLLMNLTAGSHTVRMIGNDAGFKLDVLFFTQDMNCMPEGGGCGGVSVTPGVGCNVAGDANADGMVTISDFVVWRREFLGSRTATNRCGLSGDANHDGVVNISDFTVWRKAFLQMRGLP